MGHNYFKLEFDEYKQTSKIDVTACPSTSTLYISLIFCLEIIAS